MSSTYRNHCPSESDLYGKFTHLYDAVFGKTLAGRVQRTIQSLNIAPDARVLDVGIGTGCYVTAYPHHAQVTGIDLSPDMLHVAECQARRHGWDHVDLRQMDALDLQFSDNAFDYVVAFHTVSVVADPRRLLSEMLRVCKPAGQIAIVNHFRSEHPWLARGAQMVSPITRRLGWRSDIDFDELFGDSPLEIEECYKTSRWSPFTVVVGRKPVPQPKRKKQRAELRGTLRTSGSFALL